MRARELALSLTSCSTQNDPSTSPGKHNRTGPGSVGMGEPGVRTGGSCPFLLATQGKLTGQCWRAHLGGEDERNLVS